LTASAETQAADADARPSLRARTRRAVQAELLEAAERLFMAQGYAATSVDQIATAAGMSRRSFFRYFSSKEDLVLGRYERLGEEWLKALAGRPLNEPLWTSMRRVMDVTLAIYADEDKSRRLAAMDRVVNVSATLRAGQLERFDRVQDLLAGLARERAAAVGHPWASDDPAPRAIVGAAFACFVAGYFSAQATASSVASAVDRAMSIITVHA